MQTHIASCHCQAVRAEVRVPTDTTLVDCNCSICLKAGNLHLFVEKTDFKLLSGTDQLTSYRFNTGVANHMFCSVCGIKVFYVPRSHPDGISVNARCLDDDFWRQLPVVQFDGQNWEANVAQIT